MRTASIYCFGLTLITAEQQHLHFLIGLVTKDEYILSPMTKITHILNNKYAKLNASTLLQNTINRNVNYLSNVLVSYTVRFTKIGENLPCFLALSSSDFKLISSKHTLLLMA